MKLTITSIFTWDAPFPATYLAKAESAKRDRFRPGQQRCAVDASSEKLHESWWLNGDFMVLNGIEHTDFPWMMNGIYCLVNKHNYGEWPWKCRRGWIAKRDEWIVSTRSYFYQCMMLFSIHDHPVLIVLSYPIYYPIYYPWLSMIIHELSHNSQCIMIIQSWMEGDLSYVETSHESFFKSPKTASCLVSAGQFS